MEGTLDRVSGGVLRVGVSESEPWVETGEGRPTGVEVALIDGFAREIDAQVEFNDKVLYADGEMNRATG